MSLRVRNWETFQHYRDRTPPWIKLHRSLLDDMEYGLLPALAAKYLPLVWLVASERRGVLPAAPQLAYRLRLSREDAEIVLQHLYSHGFLEDEDASVDELTLEHGASLVESGVEHDAILEGEGEKERETEKEGDAPPKRKRKTTTETALPEALDINDTQRALARQHGLNLDLEVQKFRAYCEANGTTAKNWTAKFTTWLLKAVEFRGNRPPAGSQATSIREELPRSTNGRSNGISPVGAGAPLTEQQRIERYEREYGGRCVSIRQEIEREWRDRLRPLSDNAREVLVATEYRKRVLSEVA